MPLAFPPCLGQFELKAITPRAAVSSFAYRISCHVCSPFVFVVREVFKTILTEVIKVQLTYGPRQNSKRRRRRRGEKEEKKKQPLDRSRLKLNRIQNHQLVGAVQASEDRGRYVHRLRIHGCRRRGGGGGSGLLIIKRGSSQKDSRQRSFSFHEKGHPSGVRVTRG